MGEGMKFLDPKIGAGETFRSKLPLGDESGKKMPNLHIISAHGRNVDRGAGFEKNDTGRKVEYAVGRVTYTVPEIILEGLIRRREYKKMKQRRVRSRDVGGADGGRDDEVSDAQVQKLFSVYGERLLKELDGVNVSDIEGEGCTEEQNWYFRCEFSLQRSHLQELVESYRKKEAEGSDTSFALVEILRYAESISTEYLSNEQQEDMARLAMQGPVDKTRKEKAKPEHRKEKMRQSDESADGKTGGKPVASKGASKKKDGVRARRPKEGNVSTDGIQASAAGSESVANEMPGENGNEGRDGDPTKDFLTFLDREEAMMQRTIADLQNRDDFNTPHWLHILKDGTRVFVDMTDENGLKEIHDELVRERKTSKAGQLYSQWIEANHRLEMVYLKQRLLIEILAVGADIMDRINSSSQKSVLRSIGRVIHRGASSERIFIPSDPGNSAHDPSGTEGIREAIQDMISIWREERVPKEQKGNNFEAYFKKEFSQIIDQSNRRIREFFEKKWAEMGADAARSTNAGPVKRVRRKKEQPKASTEVVDVAALERSALQSAEQYFTDEAIPAIEMTLQEAGVDLIWLLGDGEYNQQILDFVLKEVGVNIVTLAARYTGQLAEEMRTTSEQKIRDAAKKMLTKLVMRKISRMLELKTN